ncbi:uncharacterized protein LOC134856618 isoform X2 [Symsagittifera roscoffensis]
MGQKDTIMALVEQTNFSEQELKQYFKRFKKEHPDGKMDEKALRKMFESVFREGDASEISAQMMHMFDRDNSGSLDFGEVIMALSVTRKGSPEDKMRLAFDMIDNDSNGTIEYEEMVQLVTALHKMVGVTIVHVNGSAEDDTPEKHVKKMMAKLDTDNDNVISFEEFCHGLKNEPAIAQLLTVQTSPEILAKKLTSSQ